MTTIKSARIGIDALRITILRSDFNLSFVSGNYRCRVFRLASARVRGLVFPILITLGKINNQNFFFSERGIASKILKKFLNAYFLMMNRHEFL